MRTNQAHKRTIHWFIILGLTAMLLGTPLAFAAENNPARPASHEPQTITEGMTCATCGMSPHRYPQWQTQVIFADNTVSAFDGCKCMFRFLLNMQKFAPDRQPDQITAIWVKDFKTGKWIDGKSAHYVIDSSEMGPMGKELIPFATRDSAEEFKKAKGGTIDTFANINMSTIKPLMGAMHMQKNMPHSPMQ
ncbi:MAG: nitrous oxide reductase accessory protein NosL [Desulfobulbaceae bacterium]|nr:nitrous oxide reductase accessory protein NosL [Desulfobulbaceae bacterium]